MFKSGNITDNLVRKICVITGTRADYGILSGLMKKIATDPSLHLQVVVTAMHLAETFGLTYRDIEADGFVINEKVSFPLGDDSTEATSQGAGQATIGFTQAFSRLKPDIVLLLGDRIEMLAAATAALLNRIPIAHIHGGEATYGAFDDSIRHAITKMALIHFPTAQAYRRRIIQMGENPKRVFCTGALSLENIRHMSLLSKKQLEDSLGFHLGKPTFLVTYHPVTLERNSSRAHMKELLDALDTFPEAKIIFTYPNADPDNAVIRNLIDDYVEKNPDRTMASVSLGYIRYLSALSYVDAVIGNSSSGLIEVPTFKKPTINIGDRQKGRLLAPSVLCCADNKDAITESIHKALEPDFLKKIQTAPNPYEGDNPLGIICEVLRTISLDESVLKKEFYDLPVKLTEKS